jgi:GPH family glycoside/pentoside/hexuronide:cation symporter
MGREGKLRVDRQGIPLTMRQRDLWGYGMGGLGMGVISGFVGMVMYFYTDKVGFSAALAGSALLVAKVVDGLTDLVMGHLVDRTKSKWGKARPYILFMTIPTILAIFLLFAMPGGLSETGKFVYAVATNIFATAIVYTAIVVPLNCLLYYRTRSLLERTQMGVRRTFVVYVLGMLLYVGFIPLTSLLGGNQMAWLLIGTVVASSGALGLFICFKSTKEVIYEGESEKEDSKVPFLQGVGILFRNKYWLLITTGKVIAELSQAASSGTGAYYAKWVLGDEKILAILGAIAVIPNLLIFLIISPLVKKFAHRDICRYALLIGLLGVAGRIILPYNLVALSLSSTLMAFAIIPFNMVDNIMLADIADFEEWKSGKRMIGLVNSASSFGQKLGSGLGSALLGFVLALGGYQAAATVQPDTAIISIYAVCVYIPGALMLVLFLILCAYDLDKKYPHFRQELLGRRSQVGSASANESEVE